MDIKWEVSIIIGALIALYCSFIEWGPGETLWSWGLFFGIYWLGMSLVALALPFAANRMIKLGLRKKYLSGFNTRERLMTFLLVYVWLNMIIFNASGINKWGFTQGTVLSLIAITLIGVPAFFHHKKSF